MGENIRDYRVVSGIACYWIQTDKAGIIRDAAPIVKAWIGMHLIRFKQAFPRASVKQLFMEEMDDL